MMGGPHNRKIIMITGIVIGIGIFISGTKIFLFNSIASTAPSQTAIIRPVKVTVLKEAKGYEERHFPGIIKAKKETELAFRVSGPVTFFNVSEGEAVQKGDVLGRIDSRDFDLNIKRIKAILLEAEAGLEAMEKGSRREDLSRLEAQYDAEKFKVPVAKDHLDRYKALYKGEAIAKADFDKAEAAYNTAKANTEAAFQALEKARKGTRKEELNAARARVARMKTDLASARNARLDTTLCAPFSGYIHKKHIEVHENVRAGDPIISLLDFSTVEVKAAVPEMVSLRKGDITSITATTDAYPGTVLNAEITALGRKTDAANQSYPLTVELKTTKGFELRPGMAATIHIRFRAEKVNGDRHLLPAASLFSHGGDQSFIWKVDEKEMKVRKIPVTVISMHGEDAEIKKAFNKKEMIVVAGTRFLREDQAVKILNPSKQVNNQ